MAANTDPKLQNQIIYSVYVRNHTPEGTFRAVIPDLDRIRALGTDIIWFLPIHPIGVEGKKGTLGCPYANRDYRSVNPAYGTMDDFKELVREIHTRGMKCMIDVVYNHTSPDSTLYHEHPDFFYRNADGKPGNKMGDWSDVIDLDYRNKALWDYQIESLKFWAGIVDGFRCDVASFVPLEFWRAAREAVRQTAGEVLTYDGQLIDAVYFSCSGGATEAAVAVWGTDVPYLQAVESPGEEAAPRFSSRAVFSPEEFSQRLMQENPDVQLSGSPDAWLGETTRSAGGGAAICSIGGVSFSGTQLRRMFGLNSTRLTLSYQDGDFVFDVTGFGHRVGMSQYGAQTMARLGFSYQTILQYYYQGAEVERQ